MSFNSQELDKISHLARISFTTEEKQQIGENLRKIIAFVDQLSEIDVTKIEPMAYAGDRGLDLREDIAQPVLGRLSIASSAGYEDGLVRVPKIIE